MIASSSFTPRAPRHIYCVWAPLGCFTGGMKGVDGGLKEIRIHGSTCLRERSASRISTEKIVTPQGRYRPPDTNYRCNCVQSAKFQRGDHTELRKSCLPARDHRDCTSGHSGSCLRWFSDESKPAQSKPERALWSPLQ